MTFEQMAQVVGLPFKKDLIGYKLTSNPNRLMRDGVKSITVHQTGNTGYKANAQAHHNLQRNDFQGASWHWTVDEDGAIQSYRDNRVLYHSANNVGNETSMALEMCIDRDAPEDTIKGKENYLKTLDNGAKLVAIKMHEHETNIIKQHYNWSGKNCPAQLRSGLYGFTWNNFLGLIDKYYKLIEAAKNPVAVVLPTGEAPEGKLYRLSIGAAKHKSNLYTLAEQAQAAGLSPYFTIVDDPNYKPEE